MCFRMKYYSSQFLSILTVEILGREMLHVMLCTEMEILHWAVLSTCSDNPGNCKPGHPAMLPCPWLYITSACNLWVSYQLDFPHRTCIWRLWLFQAWNLIEAAVSEKPRSFLCLIAWGTQVSIKGNSFKWCLWHQVVARELLLLLLSPHVAAITYWHLRHLMLIFVV